MKQFLSSIDVYDKFSADEYRVRTVYGAILSFFLSMFGSILFFAQFVEFAIPDISRELMINRNLTSNMDRVNISISILINQPCHFLTIGNLDSLGINKFYNSTVRFIRYTKSGFYKGLADPLPNLNLNMSGNSSHFFFFENFKYAVTDLILPHPSQCLSNVHPSFVFILS